MSTNIAYIYKPKFLSPFNDGMTYLVPAIIKQQGRINYIVVCCSPEYNGIYGWVKNKEYKTWKNGKLNCYYIPISDCKFMSFEQLENYKGKSLDKKAIFKKVKEIQNEWLEKNPHKDIPEWFI